MTPTSSSKSAQPSPELGEEPKIIPSDEFANVAGRAGRAFVDVEGLVLHVIWENSASDTNRAVGNWGDLVLAAKAPKITSGILQLSVNIFRRIATKAGIEVSEVLEYVANNEIAWDFEAEKGQQLGVDKPGWDRDVASLDAAILALLDGDTEDDAIESHLHAVLDGSLFSRELAKQKEVVRELLYAFVAARARRIWLETNPAQRKGFHSAGIGLSAGKFIDANLDALVTLLTEAEVAVMRGDAASAGAAVVAFADLVFLTAPFQAPKALPVQWREALLSWLAGKPSVDVLALCDNEGVDLIQEALAYRLPWAMEAVRVHAQAVEQDGDEILTGLAALAVEAGSSNLSVITLVRAGLSSREAAAAAVTDTAAEFVNREGMLDWLSSELVVVRSAESDWPTERSRQAWLRFYEAERTVQRSKWKRETQIVGVIWNGGAVPSAGTSVIVEPALANDGGVLMPDYQPLGRLMSADLKQPRRNIVRSEVVTDGKVEIEFFGPRGPEFTS